MENVDFIQKTIKLAQSSQYLIENLCIIETEISKLLDPLTSVFSSFSDIFVKIISYQSNIQKFVQEFTLTRFELLFPYYPSEERITQKRGEQIHAKSEKNAIPLLLNLSIIKEVSNLPAQIVQETWGSPLLKPQEIEIKDIKISREKSREKTIIHYISEVQNQLLGKLSPNVISLSPKLLEYEQLALSIQSLAASYKFALFDQHGFVYRLSNLIIAEHREDTGKPDFPERLFKEGAQERLPGKLVKTKQGLSGPTSIHTIDPKTLTAVEYAANLQKTISDELRRFQKILTPISKFSPLAMAVPSRVESADNYSTNISRMPTQTPPIITLPKKTTKPLPSSIQEIKEPLYDTKVNLSALPFATSKLKRPRAETFSPAPSLEKTRIHEVHKRESEELPTPEIKYDKSNAAVEAFRVASILTSLITNLIKTQPFSLDKPSANLFSATSVVAKPPTSGGLTAPSGSSEANPIYEVPLKSALATTEKLVIQRLQQASKPFKKEIQIARSTYTRTVAELGLVGPVRATLLGELSSGLSISPVMEPALLDETTFPYTRDINSLIDQQVTSPPIDRDHRTQGSINVNVVTNVADEDLGDLERKISRLLLDQVAELGLVGPVRATLLGELSSGLSISPVMEPALLDETTDSQKLQLQSMISATSQETVNFNVFANTADEDLRNLEKRIRNILSDQLSRYYGSSKI